MLPTAMFPVEDVVIRGAVKHRLLRDIVALHQCYRFAPESLGAEERNALKAQAQEWLAEHGKTK